MPVLPDNCPPGFYVPDDKSGNNPFVWYINTTLSNCAFGCIMPVYSEDEWENLDTGYDVALALGVAMISILICTWFVDNRKNRMPLVMVFAGVCFFNSISRTVLQSIPREERFCSDEATVMSPVDGWTACNVHSFVEVYTTLALCLCWMFQAVALYWRVVVDPTFVPKRKNLIISIVLGMPLFPLLGLYLTADYGYSWTAPMCFMNPRAQSGGAAFLSVTLIVFFCVAVGACCMLRVCAQVIILLQQRRRLLAKVHAFAESEKTMTITSSSSGTEFAAGTMACTLQNSFTEGIAEEIPEAANEDDASVSLPTKRIDSISKTSWTAFIHIWETVMLLRTPIIFVTFFGIIYTTFMIRSFEYALNSTDIEESVRLWGECVLTHYDGDPTSKSWTGPCGEYYSGRLDPPIKMMITVIFSGSALLCGLIHSPEVCVSLQHLFSTKLPINLLPQSLTKQQSSPFLRPQPSVSEGADGDGNGSSFIVLERDDDESTDDRTAHQPNYRHVSFESNFRDFLDPASSSKSSAGAQSFANASFLSCNSSDKQHSVIVLHQNIKLLNDEYQAGKLRCGGENDVAIL